MKLMSTLLKLPEGETVRLDDLTSRQRLAALIGMPEPIVRPPEPPAPPPAGTT